MPGKILSTVCSTSYEPWRDVLEGSRCVVVLGVHRSGTSLVTRGLQALGVQLGNRFIAPAYDNPTGYWELDDIVKANDRVLAALGLRWWSSHAIDNRLWCSDAIQAEKLAAAASLVETFGGRSIWGFKDPRTVRVLPFWIDVLELLGPSITLLAVIRHPLSAAISLAERDSIPLADADALWLAYMLPYLSLAKGYQFIAVDYDDYVDSPVQQLTRVGTYLAIDVESRHAEITDHASRFVDPELRHYRWPPSSTDFADRMTRSLAERAYLALRQLACDDGEGGQAAFWRRWGDVEQAQQSVSQPGATLVWGSH